MKNNKNQIKTEKTSSSTPLVPHAYDEAGNPLTKAQSDERYQAFLEDTSPCGGAGWDNLVGFEPLPLIERFKQWYNSDGNSCGYCGTSKDPNELCDTCFDNLDGKEVL